MIPTVARIEQSRIRRGLSRWLAGLCLLVAPSLAFGQISEVDGLTEPFRTIDIGAPEPGVVTKIAVREGEFVRQGQLMATLDNDVLVASLAIAQQNMESVGALNSAAAELQLRKDRLAKLEELRAKEHARQEEVDRARTELEIAEAKLLSVKEDLAVKKLEHEKIKAQIERRVIRAPCDGVVTKLFRHEGEYAAPNEPTLFNVVQLHQLLAVFSVPSPATRELRLDQKVLVSFPELQGPIEGTIEFVSPVTDGESGTVRVKVRIDNRDAKYRSGERCSLELAGAKREPVDPKPVAKSEPRRGSR